MSAVNIIERPSDGLHFITDGASYTLDGRVVAFTSKTFVMPNLPAIMSSRGSAWAGPILSWEFGRRFTTFDELVEGIETAFPNLYEQHYGLFSDSGVDLIELYIGGWSHRSNSVAAYRISSFDQSGLASRADVAAELQVDVAQPFKLTKIDTRDGYVSPNLDQLALARGFGDDLSSIARMPIERLARIILELQRERSISIDPGAMPEGHYIGGFAQVTTLTNTAVTTRVVHRWTDQVGEIIQPEPIDWPVFRGALANPTAGMSRLQRDVFLRKQKKLRAS